MAETRLKDVQQQIQREALKRDALEPKLGERLSRLEEQQQVTSNVITQLGSIVRLLIEKMGSMNVSQGESSGVRPQNFSLRQGMPNNLVQGVNPLRWIFLNLMVIMLGLGL